MTDNNTKFKALFENIMESYIMNRGIPDEMQSLEETVNNILILVECSGGCSEDVTAVEEVLHKILLLGMSIGQRIGDGVESSPLRSTVELVEKSTQFDHVRLPVMVLTSALLINLRNSMDQPTSVKSDSLHLEHACLVPDDDAEDLLPVEGAGKLDITVKLA